MSGSYNRKDHFYQKAKEEGYRSRAAYKLIELNDKHKLLNQGSLVLDLGCWPGGWLQVAAEKVGPNGLVVGVDLVKVEDIGQDNVRCICGDARDEATLKQLRELSSSGFDLILSDMSPKLSGIREVDQAGSVGCAELAVWLAGQVVKSGGTLVVKVFKGNETEQFVKSTRPMFNKLIRTELDATRKSSNEFYVLGFGFKKPNS